MNLETIRQNYLKTFGSALTLDDKTINDNIVSLFPGQNTGDPMFLAQNMPAILEQLHAAETGDTVKASVTSNVVSEQVAAMEQRLLVDNAVAVANFQKNSKVTHFLVARPCPSEWGNAPYNCPIEPMLMVSTDSPVAKLFVKGADGQLAGERLKATTYEEMQAQAQADMEAYTKGQERYNAAKKTKEKVQRATKKTYLPTNEQLNVLATQHKLDWEAAQASKQTKNGKVAEYKAPEWAEICRFVNGAPNSFDNEKAINAMADAVASSKPIATLIASRDANPTAYAKAWRHSVKGYTLSSPDSEDGTGPATEKNYSKAQFAGVLLQYFGGELPPAVKDASVGAKISVGQRASKDQSANKVEYITVRVSGDGKDATVTDTVIYEPTGAKRAMLMRSELCCFVLKPAQHKDSSGNSKFTYDVVRTRLPLKWNDGPVWDIKPEYAACKTVTSRASSDSNSGNNNFAKALQLLQGMDNSVARLYNLEAVKNELTKASVTSDASEFAGKK